MARIDLNSDLGEGYGDYRMGDDAAMLRIVSIGQRCLRLPCRRPADHGQDLRRRQIGSAWRSAHIRAIPIFGASGRRHIPIRAAEIERSSAYQIGAAMASPALSAQDHACEGAWRALPISPPMKEMADAVVHAAKRSNRT